MPRIRADNIAEHKEMTRRDILAAARASFIEFGYPDTVLGDIALDAGIGRTTLYDYFEDKEAILIALVDEEMPVLIADIVAGIPKGLNARQHLGELVIRHLEFIADNNNLCTVLMRDSNVLSPEAQREIRLAHRRLESAVIEVYERGVGAGEFRPLDPTYAAELVNTVTMHAARTLLRSTEPKAEVHSTADAILDFMFDGLGSH